MTINQLRMFEIVAKYLNISMAAHELHISQPSISKQLKALQEDYGLRLYTKSVEGIRLTNEGRQFLNAVKPILLQLQELENSAKNKKRGSKFSTLTIAAAESPSVSLVPALVKAFNQNHPGVQLFWRTSDARSIERMLTASLVELAITTSAFIDTQFISEPFFFADVVAVISAKNPLTKKTKLSLEELTIVPVITKAGRRFSSQLEDQLGVKLNIILECESAEAERAAVKADVGMAFLYKDAVGADIKNGYLKVLNMPSLKKLHVRWYVVYRKDSVLSSNAQDFLTILRQVSKGEDFRSLRSAQARVSGGSEDFVFT